MKTGKIPLIYTNLRGDLQVDAISGLASTSESEGYKTLPWLEVPGFVPPKMQEAAAEAAAVGGFLTALPTPVQDSSLAKETLDTASFVLPEENFEPIESENDFVPIEVEF